MVRWQVQPGRPDARSLAAVVLAAALLLAACGDGAGDGAEEEPQDEAGAGEQAAADEQAGEDEAPEADAGSAGATPVNFQLDFLYAGYQAPFFLALEEGYWEEAGLDVTVREGDGSANGIQSLVAGQNHIGMFDRPTMAVSRENYDDLVAVMGIDNVGGWAVVTPSDAGIETPHDLVGTTIATQTGGADGAVFPAFLAANDLSEGDLTIESVDPAAKTTLLQAGSVDGSTLINYAQVPAIEASGLEVDTMLWSDWGIPIVGTGLVTTGAWAEENPEVISAFVDGVVRAFEASREDPDAAVDAFLDHSGADIDPDVARRQLELVLEAIEGPGTEDTTLGWQTEESWDLTVSTLVEVGMLEEALPIDSYYTNDYLPE